jgi:glycerophosphoryl diester phosphodiesterase
MTRPAIAALVVLILGLLVVSGWWQPHAPDAPDRQPLVTERPNLNLQMNAHRGGGLYAPENTLASIEAAIARGAAWVELDVRYTADGVPVLFHDEVVDRTTDASGPLENHTLTELQALDAGSWFSTDYADTTVPTLEQALAVMQGRICVYWDAKALPTMRAVELFRQFGFAQDCLVIRTYDEWTNMLHLLWPDAPLIRMAKDPALLEEMVSDYPWLAAIRVQSNRLDAALVDKAHALGLRVFVRAVNIDDESGDDQSQLFDSVAASGADVITLDDMDAFNTWKAGSLSAEPAGL